MQIEMLKHYNSLTETNSKAKLEQIVCLDVF